MGYSSVVVCALALITLAAALPSIRDNSLDVGERVVLVAPVLAPPKDSRAHSNDRSRQFPILVLLTQQSSPDYGRFEPEERSLKGNPQPIYVKKLEEQYVPKHNREKRHLLSKAYLGHGGHEHKHGGYGGYGGGGGGGYGGGGGGRHGGNNGGCGGGCGGGGSSSSSFAFAGSSSNGKKK